MLRISRTILGLLLIFIAIASVPAWFHQPYAIVFTLVFAFLGLWVLGGISGVSSKSVGQMFLERTTKKTLSKVDLKLEAEEEYQQNPEFRNACLKLESELMEKTDKMISQEMSKVEIPNPAFKRDSPRSGRAP